jgi:hypothetical protein
VPATDGQFVVDERSVIPRVRRADPLGVRREMSRTTRRACTRAWHAKWNAEREALERGASMNAPFSMELPHDSRRRAIEVAFLTERYHRAFDDEASTLASLASLVGEVELAASVDELRRVLSLHEHLQEERVFPAYECGTAIDAGLCEACASDTTSIAEATNALRTACRAHPPSRLCARAMHFAAEIEQHLVDEGEVFGAWARG